MNQNNESNEPAPAKHTPGKWHASNLRIFANINGLDRRVAECYRPAISGEYDGGECEANARLIAAAPETAAERDRMKEINNDLLEALKEVLSEIQAIVDDGTLRECDVNNHLSIIKARAAITKATHG